MIGLLLLAGLILPQAVSPSRAAEEEENGKIAFTVDFGTKGYWEHGDPVYVGSLLRSYYEGYTEGDLDSDSSGSMLKFDIDRDGTYDVASVTRWITEYGIPKEYIVPLPGNSLRKEVTITGTDDDWFATVTFKPVTENVKKEYTITVIGGKAYTGNDWDAASKKEYHVKAAPGTLLSIECEIPKGKYVKQFQTSDVPMYEDYYFRRFLRSFVMPAHDVTIKVVTAPQETGIIDVGQDVFVEPEIWDAYCRASGTESYDCGYKDLDGDGTYDISIGGMGSARGISALPYRSITEDYAVKGENSGLRYNRIVLHFSDGYGAYELNLDHTIDNFCENINGENVSFSEFLKAFNTADRPGFYDFDKDGNPDAAYDTSDGYCLMSVLPTYSLGERYTIPAEQLGEWGHPVTLVLKEKPQYHTVTVEAGQGGTAELFMQPELPYTSYNYEYYWLTGISADGQTANLRLPDRNAAFQKYEENRFFGKVAVFVSVTPEEGYELFSVTADENAVRAADCIFQIDGADAVISVTFRKLPEPTPALTPTPVPTAEPTPTGAEQPETVSPEPSPEQKEKDTHSPDEKGYVLRVFAGIIGAAFLLAGGITVILLRRRKKRTEPETQKDNE